MRSSDVALELFEAFPGNPRHKLRNAVMCTLKQMGQKSPEPVLAFAKNHIHHP